MNAGDIRNEEVPELLEALKQAMEVEGHRKEYYPLLAEVYRGTDGNWCLEITGTIGEYWLSSRHRVPGSMRRMKFRVSLRLLNTVTDFPNNQAV